LPGKTLISSDAFSPLSPFCTATALPFYSPGSAPWGRDLGREIFAAFSVERFFIDPYPNPFDLPFPVYVDKAFFLCFAVNNPGLFLTYANGVFFWGVWGGGPPGFCLCFTCRQVFGFHRGVAIFCLVIRYLHRFSSVYFFTINPFDPCWRHQGSRFWFKTMPGMTRYSLGGRSAFLYKCLPLRQTP